MRKVKEILRMRHDLGLTIRQISRACNMSHSTVKDYLNRADRAGIGWPIPEEWDNKELEERLFNEDRTPKCTDRYPDWAEIHIELRKKGVTLQLLCEEYRESNPDGIHYSQFCDLYRQWKKKLSAVMRQKHQWGETCFVDYAGQTLPITDPVTGQIRKAQVFIAVLGASNYTYCEVQEAQSLRHWIRGHVHAFTYFQGVPEAVVPDNLKSGVHMPCRYEPQINPTYQDFSKHYGTAIIPARVVTPRDKAKVEVGVQVVERWILARLRKRVFFSIQEANHAIGHLLEALNTRCMRHVGKSRKELYERYEKPCLRRLPERPFDYCEWALGRVVPNSYHIKYDTTFYSVPYRCIGARVDVRATDTMIEIYHHGKQISTHVRTQRDNAYMTHPFHMPPHHRTMLKWTPEAYLEWAAQIGESTQDMIRCIQATSRHPQQKSRSCHGLMRLSSLYDSDRIEAACRRALHYKQDSYKSVLMILRTGLDCVNPDDPPDKDSEMNHENIRGETYYCKETESC